MLGVYELYRREVTNFLNFFLEVEIAVLERYEALVTDSTRLDLPNTNVKTWLSAPEMI